MKVPACALNRRSSTVLVRIMDLCEFCNRRGVRALLELEEPRASYCELCSRVTSFGQTRVSGRSERKSNQLSSISKKIRFYASYILLLVGGLPPTTGAPAPISFSLGPLLPIVGTAKLCNVAYEAQNAYNHALNYSEDFVKTLLWNVTNTTVEEVLTQRSEGHSYLKDSSSFVEVMLPKCKSFGKPADKACLEPVTAIMNTSAVTTLQQQMYRGLNFVVASFEEMSKLEKLKIISTPLLNENISNTVGNMRYPSVYLKDYLDQHNSYDVSLESVKQEDLPTFGYLKNDLAIVFKDSLNFMQYCAQVFHEMSNLIDTKDDKCL